MTFLSDLDFNSSFVTSLPGDDNQENFSRFVPDACYSLVKPEPVRKPHLLAYSKEAEKILGLDTTLSDDPLSASVLSGNLTTKTMTPYAMRYGGHQFGTWASQLGDGRAICLGEVQTSTSGSWELQLKGAGPTPYSRNSDGRAVLRSSLREFLCSEAMFHLGVPTTRALSLVTTGEKVLRDMFYDGNPKHEPGAIVCRMAPSFIRFGSFQIHHAYDEKNTLEKLLEYTIHKFFPSFSHLLPNEDKTEVCRMLFNTVCQNTAYMIAHWMRVGFVHGVMNTDNMSILGLTIDYGPYGWIDGFDYNWTPNTTDARTKRYTFGKQPDVALWNLARFAESLTSLCKEKDFFHEGLNLYRTSFRNHYDSMMAQKLGFHASNEKISNLFSELVSLLHRSETDMTIFFRNLSSFNLNNFDSKDNKSTDSVISILSDAYYEEHILSDEPGGNDLRSSLISWLEKYKQLTFDIPHQQRIKTMDKVNPVFILRNYLCQIATEELQQGKDQTLKELLEAIKNPYSFTDITSVFFKKRPEWARNKAGCSMLSCSS